MEQEDFITDVMERITVKLFFFVVSLGTPLLIYMFISLFTS